MTESILPSEVDQSLYRPYKQWTIADNAPLNVVLVKRDDATCIGFCAALRIRVEREDYLEMSFELAIEIKEALGLPQNAPVVSTCVAPFNLESGEPATVPRSIQKIPSETESISSIQDEPALESVPAAHNLTDLSNACLPTAAGSGDDEEQLDMFA